MIKNILVATILAMTIYNLFQVSSSVNRCEEMIVEVNQNLEILGNEIQILSEQMGVDYE